MTKNTKIEWCDHTLNLWVGCTNISPACDNCYAENIANRFNMVEWNSERKRTSEATRKKCFTYQKKANSFRRRQRVFVNSMSDFFDNKVPQEWRDDFYEDVKKCPDVNFILLTKRPQNIEKMLPRDWKPYSNIWLGVTVENQEEARRRIPLLLEVPAALRFISAEPLLEKIDIREYLSRNNNFGLPHQFSDRLAIEDRGRLHWVICGGETGTKAREMNPEWARCLRDQCKDFSMPFFFKQMSKRKDIPDDLAIREFPSEN